MFNFSQILRISDYSASFGLQIIRGVVLKIKEVRDRVQGGN